MIISWNLIAFDSFSHHWAQNVSRIEFVFISMIFQAHVEVQLLWKSLLESRALWIKLNDAWWILSSEFYALIMELKVELKSMIVKVWVQNWNIWTFIKNKIDFFTVKVLKTEQNLKKKLSSQL